MQRVLRWASLSLFSLVALFLIWFGVTYASVTDMLWFHAAAVPETARDDVRTLYLALMNLIGSASAALGLLSCYVIAVPLRRGADWAATALLLCNSIVFIMAGVTAEELAAATGSPTSWHIMGLLMIVSLTAYALNAASRNMLRPRQGADIGAVDVGALGPR
jgi:hypothetical protein